MNLFIFNSKRIIFHLVIGLVAVCLLLILKMYVVPRAFLPNGGLIGYADLKKCDYLFVGSSHIYFGLDQERWETKRSESAYNLTVSGLNLETMPLLIQEILHHKDALVPKVIVLEINPIISFKKSLSLVSLSDIFYESRHWTVKWNCLRSMFKNESISISMIMDMIFLQKTSMALVSLLQPHLVYKNAYRGFLKKRIEAAWDQELLGCSFEEDKIRENLNILEQMITTCQKEGLAVKILEMPIYRPTLEQFENYGGFQKDLRAMLSRKKVPFLNLNEIPVIDYADQTYFFDQTHLSLEGARLVTEYVAENFTLE